MLEYNEIRQKKFIEMGGEPYEVLSSHVFRKQQRKPINQTKLKNILTGKVTEYSFHQSEKVKEANLDAKKIKYLYKNKNEHWFCDYNNPKNRFALAQEIIGDGIKFVSQNSILEAVLFGEKIIGVKIPIKVELKVIEAAPAVRGDTAQGATKQIILQTGASITTPLFVNQGDIVEINTETGEYVKRVE